MEKNKIEFVNMLEPKIGDIHLSELMAKYANVVMELPEYTLPQLTHEETKDGVEMSSKQDPTGRWMAVRIPTNVFIQQILKSYHNELEEAQQMALISLSNNIDNMMIKDKE